MSSRARAMTLDLLRSKYREAVARAQSCPSPPDLCEALSIVHVADDDSEVEISESHFLDTAKCSPGTYRVELKGPVGFAFIGEAVLADPTGRPTGEVAPTKEAARFVSLLLNEGRNQVAAAAGDLRDLRERNRELEAFTSQLLTRNRELERAAVGGAANASQRELVEVLQLLASTWLGLGTTPLTAATLRHAIVVLQIVQRSSAVQQLIITEGGGESLKQLSGMK